MLPFCELRWKKEYTAVTAAAVGCRTYAPASAAFSAPHGFAPWVFTVATQRPRTRFSGAESSKQKDNMHASLAATVNRCVEFHLIVFVYLLLKGHICTFVSVKPVRRGNALQFSCLSLPLIFSVVSSPTIFQSWRDLHGEKVKKKRASSLGKRRYTH